jgi:hypothetical protein
LRDIIQTTSRCGLRLQSAKMLEVGTGWIPTVPLGMYLLGGRRSLHVRPCAAPQNC